jgi:hypothetical protein
VIRYSATTPNSSAVKRPYHTLVTANRWAWPLMRSDSGSATHCSAIAFSMIRERSPAKLSRN